MKTRHANIKRNRAQQGLTLIELMVGLTIGVVLLSGIVQIFGSSRQSYKMSEALTYLQEGGRFAIELITKDLRRTGFWGANGQVMLDTVNPNIQGTTGFIPVTSANYDKCSSADTSWARLIEQRVFAIDDSRGGYAGCIPSTGAGGYIRGDVLAMRYANPTPATAFDANRLYVRSTIKSGWLFAGSAEGNASNTIPATDNLPTETRQLIANAYYIGDSGNTCNGDKIPALYRISLDASSRPEIQKIFEGVEQLQVQVGWDSDGDRIADRYDDADKVADEVPWTWDGLFPFTNKIVSARVWVLVRQECADPHYSNDKTYLMGDQKYIPADNFRRQLYTTTIRFRN